MMIHDLPRDIVEEILSRLPLKSMRAMRLTCKQWNVLSKTQSFSKMQIDKEEVAIKEGESQMILMRNNNNLSLVSVVNNEDPYTELKGKLTCLTEEDVNISQVYNCEGLLLCIFGGDKNTRLMVWNPYCSKTRWIKTECSSAKKMRMSSCCYGLGYARKKKNKSCSVSHKILMFVKHMYFSSWCDIYDFESDSWRALDITPRIPHWYTHSYNRGVSVKGNTYWPVTKNTTGHMYILCFDFTRERFGPLMPPPFGNVYNMTLSCVKEEKLAVLLPQVNLQVHGFRPYKFEIWITTKIETRKLSWSKFLTVDYGMEISWTPTSFIIDEEKKLVIGFDNKISIFGESGYIRKLNQFEDDKWRGYLCSYVPSLVQIKQGAGQNNAEKRRCDDKMLRLEARQKRLKKQLAYNASF